MTPINLEKEIALNGLEEVISHLKQVRGVDKATQGRINEKLKEFEEMKGKLERNEPLGIPTSYHSIDITVRNLVGGGEGYIANLPEGTSLTAIFDKNKSRTMDYQKALVEQDVTISLINSRPGNKFSQDQLDAAREIVRLRSELESYQKEPNSDSRFSSVRQLIGKKTPEQKRQIVAAAITQLKNDENEILNSQDTSTSLTGSKIIRSPDKILESAKNTALKAAQDTGSKSLGPRIEKLTVSQSQALPGQEQSMKNLQKNMQSHTISGQEEEATNTSANKLED